MLEMINLDLLFSSTWLWDLVAKTFKYSNRLWPNAQLSKAAPLAYTYNLTLDYDNLQRLASKLEILAIFIFSNSIIWQIMEFEKRINGEILPKVEFSKHFQLGLDQP